MSQCYKGSCCPLPKNVRPCTFFGFEFAVQTRTIIPGGHPVRPWFQSCDVLGDEPKTRRPKSALQTLGMPLSGSFEDGWGHRGGTTNEVSRSRNFYPKKCRPSPNLD